MEDSAFYTAPELEARRSLHEAIGRFVVTFELVVTELRSACRLMLERSGLGLKNQPLANIVLAQVGVAELTDLAEAMYREFRSDDYEGARALESILKRIDMLRRNRNDLIHSAWTLGLPDAQGGIEKIAHSFTFKRDRKKGQTVRKMALRLAKIDKFTAEAKKLQVYAIRFCQSVNQPDLSLADQLGKPV
ncbi:MAG TPA: hypothetical protein ENO18_01705 [Caldithrix sp.]|nr:hypothetical protein [Caldithrix sp.]